MNHSEGISSSQRSPSPCATSKTKMRCETQEETASRPNFASRMIRLVFKRRRRSADQRAKSWPGCAEAIPVPIPMTIRSQPSATIAIPNSLASSAPSTMPTAYTRLQRVRKHTVDDSSSEASWRQRQTHCANCERLFFKSMSTLDRFCSLDCKANFEYMSQLQGVLDAQELGFSATWTPLDRQVEMSGDGANR
ncbi:hypothetical protein PC129_g8279 [Phytophthora cactorum]|uniref:Uncharacterized protein n=2 Tax=Phytophthora cactorum TaxID=29920 RepID=A0A8T1I9K5_9STRA|nr:hypothetical protein PC112_g15510 [Phytophthora cactorum]KAG2813188.1 hypothetical protein PC111_g14500 [Phytophthora cactorum]KAG2851805.1 hypothetical protein PC113_g15586 [Phytophthora cactorum]KAG2891380.1 hypothetical protein PC114_g17019 [Phytophthora cactorum]KAG2904439.1 hypothetical protein PC115_g14973 [Phytophthora cactorum]